jgi:hypothetical protein
MELIAVTGVSTMPPNQALITEGMRQTDATVDLDLDLDLDLDFPFLESRLFCASLLMYPLLTF